MKISWLEACSKVDDTEEQQYPVHAVHADSVTDVGQFTRVTTKKQ